MKRINKISMAVAATLTLAAAAGYAQYGGTHQGGGHGMMHGMHHNNAGGHGPMAGHTAMLTKQDSGSAADMGLVHELLANHASIKRSVTNLPDGIRTLTESDDPKVAQVIKAHVASMSQRLKDGREFNIFSNTLPVLFENRDNIVSKVEITEKGAAVTRTSADAKVVAALQGHAGEVTQLVQEGMVAMHRGMRSRMAMNPPGPRGGAGVARPAAPAHVH